MNAVRPSLVSSDAMIPANPSLVILFKRLVVFVGRRQHDLAAGAHSERCCRADLLGQLGCLFDSLTGFDEPIDEAEVVRPLRRQRLAGEDHFHRRGSTDGPRQAEQPTGTGNEVALHLGKAER